MAKTYIFRWSGEYFGFFANGYLFDADCEYLGWLEGDGSVWREDGSYCGELVEGIYILRNIMRVPPMPRVPKIPPIPPLPPIPAMPRMPRMAKASWVDALDDFQPEDE